jgi:hypothetical protein
VVEKLSVTHADPATVHEFLLRMISFHLLCLEVDDDEGTAAVKAFLQVLVVVTLTHNHGHCPRPVRFDLTGLDLGLGAPDEIIEHAVLPLHPLPAWTITSRLSTPLSPRGSPPLWR